MLKRIVSFLVVFCLLTICFVPVFANETESESDTVSESGTIVSESQETEETVETMPPIVTEDGTLADEAASDGKYISAKNAGTSYSCFYDSLAKKIKINGSVTHDIFIKHRDYSIKLYKIAPTETVASALSNSAVLPLASTEISIKFNFTVDVKGVEDIFSQYVVVLVSSEGSIDFIGPLLYPSVESTYAPNTDRASYKGVVSSKDVMPFQSEPAVAVIPIHLDKLISTSSMGYLYSLDGNNVFFDKEYIDSLDRTVRNFSDGGTAIYFQLLLDSEAQMTLNSSSGTDAEISVKYDIPNLYLAETMKELYIYCDFLSDRYSNYKNGYLSGMIIGKNLDDVTYYNNNIYDSEEEYTNALALYGIIVGVATRNNIPSADIAYSFSNINTYNNDNYNERGYAPSDMIDKISCFFEDHYAEDFDFSIVLESSHRPLSISNETIGEDIDLSVVTDENYIIERSTDDFVNYLKTLDKKYDSAPCSFMYIWCVDENLSGNALACAYSYLYYKFFAVEKLTSFVVSFEDSPKTMYDILNILRYIDTEKGVSVTSQLLQFFNEYSWSDVVYAFDSYDYATRKHEILASPTASSRPMGEYYYFDFGVTSNTTSWFEGAGCSDVKISYSSLFGRALTSNFNFEQKVQTDYSYLWCSFEHPENFIFTPKLDFLLSIEGESEIIDIFEVKISFHNGNNVYESSFVVPTGSERKISIDLSDFSKQFLAEAIRISIRPMSEANGAYALNLFSVKGESYNLSSEDLENKIIEERLLIRNASNEAEDTKSEENGAVIAIAIFIGASILGVMLFIFLRREET